MRAPRPMPPPADGRRARSHTINIDKQLLRRYTSTASNYYTGLIETSKTHFYGRAAAELSFSEGILRTFTSTGLREAVSFSHCNTRLLQYVQIHYVVLRAEEHESARGACVCGSTIRTCWRRRFDRSGGCGARC